MAAIFGGGQGKIVYVMDIDDSKFIQKQQKAKTLFKDLDTTANTTAKTMGTTMAQNFQKVDQSIAKTTQTANTYNKTMKQSDQVHQTLGQKVKDLGSKFSTVGIGMSSTITSTIELGRAYRDLEDFQIAVDRSARKLSLAHESVTKAQDKLNALTAKGITSGKDYDQALLDISQAQEQVGIMTKVHGENLEHQSDAYVNFATFVLPTVLGALSTVGAAMKDLQGTSTKLKGVISGLSSSLTGMGGLRLGLLGAGTAAGAAAAGIGALLIPNLFELADIISQMQKPGADIAALTARIEDFKAKISNTDPISKFLFEFSKIKQAAVNVGGEIARQDLSKSLGNLLTNVQFKSMPTDIQAKIRGQVKFIQDAVLNPNNWTRYKKDIVGRLTIDEEASKQWSDNSWKEIQKALGRIDLLFQQGAMTLPKEAAKAIQKGVGIAEPELSAAMNSLVENMGKSFDEALSENARHRTESNANLDNWMNAKFNAMVFDSQKLGALVKGHDLLRPMSDKLEAIIKNTVLFTMNDIKSKGPMGELSINDLIKLRAADESHMSIWGHILDANVQQMIDSVTRKPGVSGGLFMDTIIGGIKDPALRQKFQSAFQKGFGDFPDMVKKLMDDAQSKTQSGLDKIVEAFHKVKGDKKKLGFEVDIEKADKKMNKFLADVAIKFDKGGSEGAKKYVEAYVKEAGPKMKGAARVQFQPILDYVEKHKGDDARSWMEGFLNLLDGMSDETKKQYVQLMLSDKDWAKHGGDAANAWGEKFNKNLKKELAKAEKAANKAAREIEQAMHLPSGTLGKFDVNEKNKAKGGLMHFAQGGFMSAASGVVGTTRGPQMVIVGDNPGGKETVAFIPHNDPWPTLEKLAALFGGSQTSKPVSNANATGLNASDMIVEVHNHYDTMEQVRRLKYRIGTGRSKFGF